MRHVRAFVLAVSLIGNPLTAGAETVSIEPMPPDRFWAIVDATTQHAANPRKQLASLASLLSDLSDDDVVAFDFAFFGREMQRAYTWDLWGAAYIIQGGASDDGFAYFRYWLISRGREVFEAALRNPDDLADLIPPEYAGEVEFEDIAYVAREVWDRKHDAGSPGANEEFPLQEFSIGSLTPSGERFEEDGEHLARRFPRLWKRFGNDPLPHFWRSLIPGFLRP